MYSLYQCRNLYLSAFVEYFQINPPYFIPLVEMVPAPWTKPEVMVTTRTLMEEIGQSPVSLKRECPGFALNRLQYACINEAWNMYQVSK